MPIAATQIKKAAGAALLFGSTVPAKPEADSPGCSGCDREWPAAGDEDDAGCGQQD